MTSVVALPITLVVFGFICVMFGLFRFAGSRDDKAMRFAVRGVVWMMVGAALALLHGLFWFLALIFGGAA